MLPTLISVIYLFVTVNVLFSNDALLFEQKQGQIVNIVNITIMLCVISNVLSSDENQCIDSLLFDGNKDSLLTALILSIRSCCLNRAT